MRRAATALSLAAVLVTSGCLGVVAGDPIAFEAAPATVGDGALQQYGFELGNESTITVEREADLPVVGTRTVRVTNHVAAYRKVDPGGNATGERSVAALVVLSTPQAQVLGQEVNPLGRIPPRELLERVAGRTGAHRDVEQVGSRGVTVLGTETRARKFAATTEVEGRTVRTYLYVARVRHDGDYVVAVGVLPRSFEDDEPAIYGMMAAIEHGS